MVLRGLPLDLDATIAMVQALAAQILTAMGLPFELEGYAFHTSASIGIALFHGTRVEVEDLLKRADLAMYAAKATGRGSLRFFEPSMQAIADQPAGPGDGTPRSPPHGRAGTGLPAAVRHQRPLFCRGSARALGQPEARPCRSRRVRPAGRAQRLVGAPRRVRAEGRLPGIRGASPATRRRIRFALPSTSAPTSSTAKASSRR